MKAVFADALYWIAIVRPNDPWKAPAKRARKLLGKAHLITTDEVLIEFLAALSGGGIHLRQQAAKMVRAILSAPDVKVISQSRESFLRGLNLYEHRLDKAYSLTDCISMETLREQGLTEVLTNDNHFAQEGFTVLLQS